MPSFWSDLFDSPQNQANQDIYSDWSKIQTPEDVERKYGLKKRTAADVSQIFNPARATLATRQAQSNQAAGARMNGSNATPQGTFGGINSQYADAFGDLEGQAAKTGLDVERGDEENVAKYLRSAQEGREQAAQGLSKSSGLDDILGVVSTAAKFFPPTAAVANIAGGVKTASDIAGGVKTASDILGGVKTASDILGGGSNPSQSVPDYSKMFSTRGLSGSPYIPRKIKGYNPDGTPIYDDSYDSDQTNIQQ